MTPKERLEAIKKGKKPDRMPVKIMFNSAAGVVKGISYSKMFESPKQYASCQIEAYRRFGQDGVSVSYTMHGIGIAHGAKVKISENNPISIQEYPMKNIKDLGVLDLSKVDPDRDKTALFSLEAADIIIKEIGDEVGVGISFPGPATAAVSLLGMSSFMKAMIKNPEEVEQIFSFTTEAVLALSKPFIALGVGVGISDPVASGMIIGKKKYQSMVLPYTKKIFNTWKKNGVMARGYHVCGDTTNILYDMAESGATSISIDNLVNLKTAKEYIGNKVAISGNIDPVQIIKLGSENDIKNSIKKAYEDCWDSPMGYTLNSGCGIPVGIKLDQIDMYMAIAKDYAKCFYNLYIT